MYTFNVSSHDISAKRLVALSNVRLTVCLTDTLIHSSQRLVDVSIVRLSNVLIVCLVAWCLPCVDI